MTAPPSNTSPLLTIRDLSVNFGERSVVNGVSLDIHKGETVALVGESGSGKSVTALSILQLLPYPTASHPRGSIRFLDNELLGASHADLLPIRGDRISMIFQEPMTALNPVLTIGDQVAETARRHLGVSAAEARNRAIEALRRVGGHWFLGLRFLSGTV